MDCVFCKVLKGEIPTDFTYQDKDFAVFKDISPKAPTHLLLITKKHIPSVKELKSDEAELVGKLIILAQKVAKDQNLIGYKLVFNVGRDGGQVIDHLHLHLLGGWNNKSDKALNV